MSDHEYGGNARRPDIAASLPRAESAPDDGASPIPGMDLQTFKNLVMNALSGDSNVPAGIRTFLAGAHVLPGDPRAADAEDRWRMFWQEAVVERFRRIEGLIAQYTALADWHHEQAEGARLRMSEATDKLHEIGEFLDGADDVFAEFKRTGNLDREAALQLLKSRGVQVDPAADQQTLLMLLTQEKERARNDRLMWTTRYDQAREQAEYHHAQERENIEKARELVQRRDAALSSNHDPTRALNEIADEYGSEIQYRAAEMASKQGDLDQARTLDSAAEARFKNTASRDEGQEFLAAADALLASTESPNVTTRDAGTPAQALTPSLRGPR